MKETPMGGEPVADARKHGSPLRWLAAAALVPVVLAAVGPCTVTRKYGPYQGRVIEEATGDPIEGALVLMVFFTQMYTFGGFTSHFVDAVETTTDAKGKFNIPARRLWAFRLPHKWDDIAPVTIFKPGCGAYSMRIIPQDEHVTIRLPKLMTREERLDNLILPPGVPDEKLRNLMQQFREERKRLGVLK